MDPTTIFLIVVGVLAAIAVAYVLIRKRRSTLEPTPEIEQLQPEPGVESVAELLEPGIGPVTPVVPPVPTVAPLVPQFFELTTTGNKLIRLTIDKTLTTLGRAPDNDIVVDERFPGYETVAEHHAHVELRDDLVVIKDLESPTGVFVNDRRTGKNLLRNGWRVGLGDVELVFRTIGLGTAPLNLPEMPLQTAEGEPVQPRHEARPFAALPEGAIIADRYSVVEVRSESPHLNVYIIENLDPVRRCLQCGYEENALGRMVCLNCSAPLDDALPYYPHHQAKETDNLALVELESRLVGLTHPAVLLPREALDEIPYGDVSRRYLIGPDAPRHLAAAAHVPQKVVDVLDWGVQLAEGLAYLHQNNVVMGAIDGWRVALEGRQAYWTDFAPCRYITDEQDVISFTMDVIGLASILHYLMTGQREYTSPATVMPPVVGALLDQALDLKNFKGAEQFAAALQATLVEVRRPSSMDLRVGRFSDVGQVRQLNEDSVLALELARIRRSISESLGLYAVADGMGGHAAGDVASALTIDTLARKAVSELWVEYLIESEAIPDASIWLKLAVQEANQAVFGRRRASTSDMGTTLVVALIHSGVATIAHAGDSRAYLIREGEIRQITTDHSLVQRLVQMGQLTPEEARIHPQRNVIYKNLGDKPRIEPDVTEIELAPDDQLLLCSDGLNGMLSDEVICEIAMSAASPQAACQKLVEAANEAGGEDNISAVLVRIEALG